MSGGTMNLLDNSPCGNPAITQDCARNSGTSNLKHHLPPSKYSRRPGDGQLRRGLGGHVLCRGPARGGGRGGGARGGRGRGGGAGHDAGGRHDLAARGPGGGAQGAEEGDGPQRLDADRQTRQIVSGGVLTTTWCSMGIRGPEVNSTTLCNATLYSLVNFEYSLSVYLEVNYIKTSVSSIIPYFIFPQYSFLAQ